MQALISRGIARLIRTGSNLIKREAPALLPTFPETDRLFFLSPHLLTAHLRQGGLTHPYKDHVWVYSCVNAIAQNLMGIPLLFFTGSRKDKKLVEAGPLMQLFETPNPMMSGAHLIEATFVLLGALRGGYLNRRKSESSSVGESHTHALTDPYMSLSAHTAPIDQPQLHGLALPNGSSHCWLATRLG